MSDVKIKLTTYDGNDYGYVKLGEGSSKKHFLGKASVNEATTFEQVKYKKTDNIFYYKVVDENAYLDEHTRSGVVYPESKSSFVPLDMGSIHAWQLNEDNNLVAIYAGKGAEALGQAHTANQSNIEKEHPNALFCNFTGYPFTVELIPV